MWDGAGGWRARERRRGNVVPLPKAMTSFEEAPYDRAQWIWAGEKSSNVLQYGEEQVGCGCRSGSGHDSRQEKADAESEWSSPCTLR